MDNILISDLTNIRYLTGFKGTYGFLLILDGRKYLFTDSRYYERAGREAKGVKVRLIKDDWPSVLSRYKIRQLGFEANSVSYADYQMWRKSLKKIRFIPTRNVVERIRQIKKTKEINAIRKAIRITKDVLSRLRIKYSRGKPRSILLREELDALSSPPIKSGRYSRAVIKPGITEFELSKKIEGLIRAVPGAEPAFHAISVFGPNSSMPHALPGRKRLTKNQIVLIDLGVRYKGYSSDLTRTFWVGRITKKFKEIYDIVLTAQRLAINSIRPGRQICEIDSLARDYIREKGYGRYFGHALGHGIGLQVHELPRINSKNKERLAEGMIFSVEPGVYIPAWGGVRIEDLVLVTKDGCKVLTTSPKNLDDIVI